MLWFPKFVSPAETLLWASWLTFSVATLTFPCRCLTDILNLTFAKTESLIFIADYVGCLFNSIYFLLSYWQNLDFVRSSHSSSPYGSRKMLSPALEVDLDWSKPVMMILFLSSVIGLRYTCEWVWANESCPLGGFWKRFFSFLSSW